MVMMIMITMVPFIAAVLSCANLSYLCTTLINTLSVAVSTLDWIIAGFSVCRAFPRLSTEFPGTTSDRAGPKDATAEAAGFLENRRMLLESSTKVFPTSIALLMVAMVLAVRDGGDVSTEICIL